MLQKKYFEPEAVIIYLVEESVPIFKPTANSLFKAIMKPNLTLHCIAALLLFLVSACSKNDSNGPGDPCIGVNFNINSTKTEAVGTSNNGTITILEPRGDTMSYQLNSGVFQSSWYFTNLAPGNYVVTMKNQHGCSDTAQISILNYGPKYALVKEIIVGYCGPCHRNGGMDGNKNFDTDANIISNWDRIKARAVDNIPTVMPASPNLPLTNVDKQKITDWVNAGHRISD